MGPVAGEKPATGFFRLGRGPSAVRGGPEIKASRQARLPDRT